MSALFHIILIIGNILLSFLISIYAPGLISDIDTISARILGGSFFLLLLQLHILLFVVRVNKDDATERLLALHQDYQVYQDQLENIRREFVDLKKQVEPKEFGQNKEIINEMRLLQTLLGQVVEKSGKSYSSSGKVQRDSSIEVEHGGGAGSR
jgi:cyclic-di-GMP phosphodiesterase TipF (flagellum assembly factor)